MSKDLVSVVAYGWMRRGELCLSEVDVWESPLGLTWAVPRGVTPHIERETGAITLEQPEMRDV
jgi:hypothetical protein